MRVDEDAGLDDLMGVEDRATGARKAQLPKLRAFWHAATRGKYWPATVIVTLAVVGVLIYFAVGLIAGFFAGMVE
ncbi:hypothetical protein DMH04_07220 [Kibdelosporangium aridum]|uniref:Uncharacterized protein n=1 Tax=Kibdelosporangium aridum TaxID=2030 RepID=A0A428ZNV5_KIBAR|nr:hypothetical protein DMH04_07220 [Kibdelosporangium aridum]